MTDTGPDAGEGAEVDGLADATSGGSRRWLLAKAVGLLVIWLIVGAGLLVVLWLLVAIMLSVFGSL